MLSFVGAIDPAGVSRCVGLNAVKIKVENIQTNVVE